MSLTVRHERPNATQMEDFSQSVAMWLKLDTEISRLMLALRERRAAKLQLTQHILSFMTKFGIDDLDTLECRISCRVRRVKTPLPYRTIQERLAGIYANDPITARSITAAVFNRDRVEKVSLRRSMRTGE